MNTKRLTVLCLLLIITTHAETVSAQTKGLINYVNTVNDGVPGSPRTINYALSFSGNRSIEVPLRKSQVAGIQPVSDATFKAVVNTGSKKPFIYKDLGSKKLILSDHISVNPYLVSDTLHNFNWDITTEKMTILDYECTKATTIFRGRKYIAWFAEAIAIPFGPWKFGGLPGLIIKVSDEEEKYKFELSGIHLKTGLDAAQIIVPDAYSRDTPMTHHDFNRLFNTKKEQLKAKSRIVSYGTNSSSSTSFTLPERMELF